MLSIPPATTTVLSPDRILWAAIMIDFIPLAQTLLTVVASELVFIPAPRATCRAGDWPTPACTTLPKYISSATCGLSLACSNACFRATIPSWGAVNVLRDPFNEPIGVRLAATITASLEDCKEWLKMDIFFRAGHTIERDKE